MHTSALNPNYCCVKKENINYQAVEIENFFEKSVTQALLMLTPAITHLEDIIAWCALLRAPWCGISLQDLYLLTQICPTTLIWNTLAKIDTLSMTQEGKQKLKK